jgi:hypothetical protein
MYYGLIFFFFFNYLFFYESGTPHWKTAKIPHIHGGLSSMMLSADHSLPVFPVQPEHYHITGDYHENAGVIHQTFFEGIKVHSQ